MRTSGSKWLKNAALLVAAAMIAGAAVSAQAQVPRGACMVSDPTGTPLNLRESPGGPIVGSLNNGEMVAVITTEMDARGRSWALVADPGGSPMGWVFREYISCRQ